MQRHEFRSYFLLALIALSLALAFYILEPFLAPLLLAAIFAVVLSPIQSFFLKHCGGWKSVSALSTILVALVCILIPLLFIVSLISVEAQQLYALLSSGGVVEHLIASIQAPLSPYLPVAKITTADFSAHADSYVQQITQWFVEHSLSAATGAANFAINILLFFIALFYMLRDGRDMRRTLMNLSPLTEHDDDLLFGKLALAVNSVIRGNLAVAFIQGLVASIGFTIFGVPQSILFGVAAMFFSLIPGLGTSFVTVPIIVYTFITGGILQGLGLAAWAIVAVALIDNYLSPKLIGKGMQIHPLLVLFSVLGGVAVFGPVGIFLGPLSISFLAAIVAVYLERTDTAAA